MKAFILFLALSLNVFSEANCPLEFSSENLCAELTWIDGPYLNEESTFEVRFWNKFNPGKLVSPQNEVEMYSWMIMDNGHSHGGPAISWTEESEGLFMVEDARFFMMGMKGYWNIVIRTLDESGSEIQKKMVRVQF